MSELKQKNNPSLSLRFIENLLNWTERFFNTVAVLFLIAIVFVVLYQIVARFALPKPPVWTEELSRYLFIYMIVLAAAGVTIRKRHVKLELFQHKLPFKISLSYACFCHILVACFAIYLVGYAWEYIENGQRQTSPALGIQMNWIFASTGLFFVLVSICSVLLIVRDFMSLFVKRA